MASYIGKIPTYSNRWGRIIQAQDQALASTLRSCGDANEEHHSHVKFRSEDEQELGEKHRATSDLSEFATIIYCCPQVIQPPYSIFGLPLSPRRREAFALAENSELFDSM